MAKATALGMGDVIQTLLYGGARGDVVDDKGRNLLQLAEDSQKKWITDMVMGFFPQMQRTNNPGRQGDARCRGQMRRDVDLATQHPKGNKGKGKKKRL